MVDKKVTKKQQKINEKKELRLKDANWAKQVKERIPACVICGATIRLNAHHIIPREIKETRHDPLNGISLCPKHHKFGIFSAHRNPLWFLTLLKLKAPNKYNYLVNQTIQLDLKYTDTI